MKLGEKNGGGKDKEYLTVANMYYYLKITLKIPYLKISYCEWEVLYR